MIPPCKHTLTHTWQVVATAHNTARSDPDTVTHKTLHLKDISRFYSNLRSYKKHTGSIHMYLHSEPLYFWEQKKKKFQHNEDSQTIKSCAGFLLCVGKGVCAVKQMAAERARERKQSSWEPCMEEFILYVSPNWSPWQFPVSLIHTWQRINLSTLFRCSISLPLGIEIQTANVPICMCHRAWTRLCA